MAIVITEEAVHLVILVEIIQVILVEDQQKIVFVVVTHLVVMKVFLLVDLKDHKANKDLQDFQGPSSERVSDPNITFNTTDLETSFTDLSQSMFHLQAQTDALKEFTTSN